MWVGMSFCTVNSTTGCHTLIHRQCQKWNLVTISQGWAHKYSHWSRPAYKCAAAPLHFFPGVPGKHSSLWIPLLEALLRVEVSWGYGGVTGKWTLLFWRLSRGQKDRRQRCGLSMLTSDICQHIGYFRPPTFIYKTSMNLCQCNLDFEQMFHNGKKGNDEMIWWNEILFNRQV